MTGGSLDDVAAANGIGGAYHDWRGELKVVSAATKAALLASMGITDAGRGEPQSGREETTWQGPAPAIVLCRDRDHELMLPAPMRENARPLAWQLHTETGQLLTGRTEPGASAWILPDAVPDGTHVLTLQADSGRTDTVSLIVVPPRCHLPVATTEGLRLWGITLQLYTLRSAANWGIGDFGDLMDVVAAVAPLGCALIGLNPLHALMPADPLHASPYSPSNRQFLNVLYIAVPRIPEFTSCTPAARFLATPEARDRLAALRDAGLVDHAGVATLKLKVLREVYEHFRVIHLAQDTARARAFRDFYRDGGEALLLHATFDALHARFEAAGIRGGPSAWPARLRDPASAAVREFQVTHAVEVGFHLYLQWIATEQLAAVQAEARRLGMAIGLYGDVAVGVNAGGSEAWSNPSLFVTGASIGAPPDPLALKGQDWGIPPQDPRVLKAQAYRPFFDLLRFNMQHAGALRLDHVMALFRQWWVPRGFAATEGAYVHYPLADLAGILALESRRFRCLVVGEDLGTVPDTVREAMQQHDIAHYRVLLFEREPDGRFRTPAEYAQLSLAAVATHDLPTFRGWWEGRDIVIAGQLGLYPDADTHERVARSRETDRRQLMQALVAAGLWHWQPHEELPAASFALVRAVHLYLGLSAAAFTVIQLEDLAGMTEPVNVPGTHVEYPNWRRKMNAEAPEILARAEVREMLGAMGVARTGRNPN